MGKYYGKAKKNCCECLSEFFIESSVMKSLCPECAHLLYGYPNCKHKFVENRCVNCYWNGNNQNYIKTK